MSRVFRTALLFFMLMVTNNFAYNLTMLEGVVKHEAMQGGAKFTILEKMNFILEFKNVPKFAKIARTVHHLAIAASAVAIYSMYVRRKPSAEVEILS